MVAEVSLLRLSRSNTAPFRVVLTGGPGGGKTTILRYCMRLGEIYGHQLFVANESAMSIKREGGRSGMKYRSVSTNFQRIVINRQLEVEETIIRKARLLQTHSIVLLDRGIFDSVGYIHVGEYERLLTEKALTVSDVLARYDKVIFLRSAVPHGFVHTKRFSSTAANQISHIQAVESVIEEHLVQHPNVIFVPVTARIREKLQLVLSVIAPESERSLEISFQ